LHTVSFRASSTSLSPHAAASHRHQDGIDHSVGVVVVDPMLLAIVIILVMTTIAAQDHLHNLVAQSLLELAHRGIVVSLGVLQQRGAPRTAA
jgi:hypothetical protein